MPAATPGKLQEYEDYTIKLETFDHIKGSDSFRSEARTSCCCLTVGQS